MPKPRLATSDRRCRCCGMIVVHQSTMYNIEHHYYDYGGDGRKRLYCSKRCLLKGAREEEDG
jgi:hypothetical protein